VATALALAALILATAEAASIRIARVAAETPRQSWALQIRKVALPMILWRAGPAPTPDPPVALDVALTVKENVEVGAVGHPVSAVIPLPQGQFRRTAVAGERGYDAAKQVTGRKRHILVDRTAVAGERGYDAAKQVTGRKRHILVDVLGLLIDVVVTKASVPEREGAKLQYGSVSEERNPFSPRKRVSGAAQPVIGRLYWGHLGTDTIRRTWLKRNDDQ
jgi:hypothetical protein